MRGPARLFLLGLSLAILGWTASPAIAQPTQQEFTIVNPTSKAKLWATVFSPADAGKDKKYPAVVFVPGGLGFGSGMARTPLSRDLPRAGFVLCLFDPDGRGRSEGKEDFNGKVHQDGLHAFLKHVADLPQVQKDNIGVFSNSLGLAMAAGTLARYPDDPKVKYFIDEEGPSDRFYITKRDTFRFGGHTTKDEEWWAEREAVRSIKQVRCAYLRIQRERDHIHGEDKQHALDMMNAATQEKFGGKGKAPWTRINGAENKANRTYTKDDPPKWLPARAGGPPGGEETLKWIREMSGTGDQPKPKEEGGPAPGAGRKQDDLAAATAEELRLTVPKYREVRTHLHRPRDLKPGEKRPCVLFVFPGKVGASAYKTAADLAASQRLITTHFSPADNLPAEFNLAGREGLGHAGQDVLHALLKHLLSLPEVEKENVGIVTHSGGIVAAVGALARHPEIQVKFLIDCEGPAAIRGPLGKPPEKKYAEERAASEFIKKIKCCYLRVQGETDHAQPGINNQHAIEMLNNATSGMCPWTRCNDNKPNILYDAEHPEREMKRWFPGRITRQEMDQKVMRYVKEMVAMPPPALKKR